MTEPAAAIPEPHQPEALPAETREGMAHVAVTSEYEAAHLVSDSIGRTIVHIAGPAVASSLLMTLFSTLDAFWVGTRIGAAGLAAVSTSLFWIWMLLALGEMVGVGLTAVAARRHGQRAHAAAARLSGDAIAFTVALGSVVAAVGVLALDALFGVMHTPPEVTALGRAYLGTYLLGTPLVFGFIALDAAFRAAGDTRTPFVILAVSVAITLVLDPALIMGLGPAPKLGIAGAAVATIATRGGAFVVALWIGWRRKLVRFGRDGLAGIRSICRVGLPTAATGMTFSLIYIFITRTTTRFGTPALAALGIGHRVESWLYMIGVGVGAATAAIVGQNLGAGRADRAERAGWLAVGMCTAFGLVACGAELIWAERLAALFTHEAPTIAEGARYLRVASLSQLGICAEIVLEAALGGAGDTLPPMLSSTTITASRIPLAGWSASRWGSLGIWWTISLTALARALAMVALWRRGGWKHKSV